MTALILAALVAGAPIAGAPHPGRVAAQLPDGFRVDVSTKKFANAAGTRGFTATILSKSGRRTTFLASFVEWPSRLTLLDRHRAILFGGVTGVVDGFTIFDPLAGKILLQVPCEDISPSPDRKRIAFVRFFTPHFVPLAATTFVYAVLDVTAAIDNPGSDIRFSGAGTRVYPASDPGGDIKTDNDVHRLVDKIVWQSPSRFTFEDAYHGVASTVVVSWSGHRRKAAVVSTRPAPP
jgi:hypothetical protein